MPGICRCHHGNCSKIVRLTRDKQPAHGATQGDEPDHGNDEQQIFTSHETSRLRAASPTPIEMHA